MIGSESETLKIVIKARDEASKVFGDFSKKHEKAIKNIKKYSLIGGAAVLGIGTASVKMAVDFNKSMANVSTLVDTGIESMDDMKEAVLDLSKRTPVALGDLSSALYDVRSAGIDAGSAMKVLEDSAKLGVAGLGTTKEAANLLTTAINAFGLQGRDSAEVADILFKTVEAGKTDIAQLSQAFGKMAGNAKAANVSFEDVQAATAALTALTGKTSESQNALAQAFLELTVQGGKLDKGLQENGLSLDELNEMIGEHGLVGGMKMMQEELGLTETEFKNLFSSAEAGTSIYQLLTDAFDANEEALEEMKNGSDKLEEAYKKQTEEAWALSQMLKNELSAELIELGNVILPKVVESVKYLTDEIKKLNPEQKIFIAAVTALVVVIGPLLIILPGIIAAVKLLAIAIGLTLSPLGLGAIALVALTGFIVKSIIETEKFKKLLKDLKKVGGAVFNHIKKEVGKLINSLQTLGIIAEETARKVGNEIEQKTSTAFGRMEINSSRASDKVNSDWAIVSSNMGNNFWMGAENIKNASNNMSIATEEDFKAIGNHASTYVTPSLDNLGGGVDSVAEKAKKMTDTFKEYMESIKEFGQETADTIVDITKKIGDLEKKLTELRRGYAMEQNEERMRYAEEYINQEQKVADAQADINSATTTEARIEAMNRLAIEKETLEQYSDFQQKYADEIAYLRAEDAKSEMQRAVESIRTAGWKALHQFKKEEIRIRNEIIAETNKLVEIKRIQDIAIKEHDKFLALQELHSVDSINRQIEKYNELANAIARAAAGQTSSLVGQSAGTIERATQTVEPYQAPSGGITINVRGDVSGEDLIEKVKDSLWTELKMNGTVAT